VAREKKIFLYGRQSLNRRETQRNAARGGKGEPLPVPPNAALRRAFGAGRVYNVGAALTGFNLIGSQSDGKNQHPTQEIK
jgi:hypothetical protein